MVKKSKKTFPTIQFTETDVNVLRMSPSPCLEPRWVYDKSTDFTVCSKCGERFPVQVVIELSGCFARLLSM